MKKDGTGIPEPSFLDTFQLSLDIALRLQAYRMVRFRKEGIKAGFT